MRKNLQQLLQGFGFATSLGLLTMLWVAPPALAQSAPDKKPMPAAAPDKDAQDAAKDTAADAKDTAKDVKSDAKDTTQDAKDAAKDTSSTAKDAAKDTSSTAKDAAKDTSSAAKDAAKDARDTAKDTSSTAKDAAKDTRDAAKDTAKDASRDARDTTRDARDTAKDATRDARDTARDPRTPRDSRDTTRDSRDVRDTRDTTRDARDRRDTTRDTRDTVRDTRDTRDTVRDTRDTRDSRTVRDTDRSSTDVRRDSNRTESRTSYSARGEFDVSTFRSADMGLWLRSSNDGLVIRDIASSGPITKFGFREGDVVVSVNGQRVTRERDFVTHLFADDVREDRVKVIVMRGGRQEVIWIEPTVIVEHVHVHQHDPLEEFGIIVDDRYDDRIVVLKVFPRTPAYYAGIRAGDVITVFDGHTVATPREFVTYVRDVRSDNVVVEVNRNRQVRELDVEFTSVRDSRDEVREERREEREERRDERRDVRDQQGGARINVDTDGAGAPRVNVDRTPGAAPRVNVQTPGADVNVQPPRGGVLPRIRNR